MDSRKTVLVLVGMLCVKAICIFGHGDTAPSALNLLWLLLARARLSSLVPEIPEARVEADRAAPRSLHLPLEFIGVLVKGEFPYPHI